MTALIALDVAKQHLRVDHTDDDADIQRKLDQANAIVLDYIKKTPASGGSGGTVEASARFDDGAATIALPDWHKVTFSSVIGGAATVENGDLRILPGDETVLEVRVMATHSNNRWAMFGYGIDGAPPVELGRAQIKTNQPVFLIQRNSVDTTAGGLFAVYLSSDSTNAPMSWTGGEVNLVEMQPATDGASTWTPTTMQTAILEAATLMVLSKLYDDRNIGEESNDAVALGYLTPQVTAILHRLRDPAVA